MSKHNSFFVHLKSLVSRKQRVRPFINPLREWGVCLFLSSLCAIGLIGHAAYDFNTQLRGQSDSDTPAGQIPKYRPEEAELILRYYEGRARTFEAFRNDTPAPVPSPIVPADPVGEALPAAI